MPNLFSFGKRGHFRDRPEHLSRLNFSTIFRVRVGDDFQVKVDLPPVGCQEPDACPEGSVCPDEHCQGYSPDGGPGSGGDAPKGCGCQTGFDLSALWGLGLYFFLKRASKAALAASSAD